MSSSAAATLSLSSGPSTRQNLSSRKLSAVPLAELAPYALTLRALDLSSNALGGSEKFVLPPELPVLEELRLSDNVLDAAAVQRASPWPAALRVLDLGANRLTVFPPGLLRLPRLTVLKIDRQRLRALPPELALLSELHELDAGFNELSSALPLAPSGLPRLRRLVLRSNALTSSTLRFDPLTLPSLTDLDVASNLLDVWPEDLGKLDQLRSLDLTANKLHTLVSSETVANKRLWMPSSGVHTLTLLAELGVAQNALVDLPAALNQLRALRRLDVRCNPLSPQSTSLATEHCRQLSAKLLSSAISERVLDLRLGDESSAWHRGTLLRAQVGRILSIGFTPADGVAASRLAAKLPDEFKVLGLQSLLEPETEASGGTGTTGTAAVVTVESLKRAFHTKALATHPDKQPEGEQAAAAESFAKLKEAYRVLGRAVAMERRRLPQLESFTYSFMELPSPTTATSGEEDEKDAPAILVETFRAQLPAALAFAREGRAASAGDLLVHPAGPSAVPCALAATLALVIDGSESLLSVADAERMLQAAMGRGVLPELPAALRAELDELAADKRRRHVHVEVEGGATSTSSTSMGTDPINFDDDDDDDDMALPLRPMKQTAFDPTPAYARKKKSAEPTRSTYTPNLTMVDPFGGDIMKMGGGHDIMSSRGGSSISSSGGGGLEFTFGGLDLSDAGVGPDADDDEAPGRSVDSEGRTVITLKGVAQAPNGSRFKKVIIEVEEGARIGHSSGGERTDFVG